MWQTNPHTPSWRTLYGTTLNHMRTLIRCPGMQLCKYILSWVLSLYSFFHTHIFRLPEVLINTSPLSPAQTRNVSWGGDRADTHFLYACTHSPFSCKHRCSLWTCVFTCTLRRTPAPRAGKLCMHFLFFFSSWSWFCPQHVWRLFGLINAALPPQMVLD